MEPDTPPAAAGAAAAATAASFMGLAGEQAEPGVVYLVGGGPGDPALLSLRAAQLLHSATVVAYDRLAPAAALQLCSDGARLVYVGKSPDHAALTQEQINDLLVSEAQAGHAVVRLKGGDPFVLGRGSEEAQACRAAAVDFEVVPGVTSAIAGPAYAGIPVTHRGLAPAFAVVTGHEDPGKDTAQVDYGALASFPGTLVLLMGVGRLDEIAKALQHAGRAGSTPAAVVQWASTPRQRSIVAPLDEIAQRAAAAGLSSPAVIVIGDVAALRSQLAWFEGPDDLLSPRRPLHGRRVLVPRTRQQASELSSRLRALGAEPVEAPTIAIEPTPHPEALRQRLREVIAGAFDWLALTSVNGVTAVWEQLRVLGGDARLLARVRLAAVGSGTADAFRRHGLEPDLVPERYTTRGLAEALIGSRSAEGARILLPRADIATPTLTHLLREAGWDVTEVEAYRTVGIRALAPEVATALRDGELDLVAFASSSTVRNLVGLLGGPPHPAIRVVSIGPVTTETCRELGLRVDAEADPHDSDGLVRAVVAVATLPVGHV